MRHGRHLVKAPRLPALKLKASRDAVAWALIVAGFVAGVAASVSYRSREGVVRQQATAKRAEIQRVRTSGLHTLGTEEIAQLQKRAADFKRGFVTLSQMPVVLDDVSVQAEKHAVKVVSVVSEPPERIRTPEGGDFLIEGSAVSRVPIRLRVECTNRSLGNFLRSMAVSSPRLFAVESYTMKKIAPDSGKLESEVTLSFFSSNA